MAKSILDAKVYESALKLSQEIENSVMVAATVRFDKSRWPQILFQTFPIAAATCAVSPDSSYRFLKSAIDAAKSTLDLYIYDVSAPYLVDLLTQAKKRGVKIRSMYDANSQGNSELALLKAVGQTKAAPSSGDRQVFTVCHQKFLVIDKATLLVESANWAKTSVPQITKFGTYKKGNREWLIRIDDAQVAKWFAALFQTDWNIPAAVGLQSVIDVGSAQLDVAALTTTQPPSHLFDIDAIKDGQAKILPILSPNNYLTETKALLNSAKKTICLQQQYVLAGNGVKDLVEIMAKKRQAGIDIKVISSAAFPENWQATQLTLKSAGLLSRLKAVNPASFTHCHNKGVIVDGKSVIVSSTNWSENSITRAREAGLLIHSQKIARYYQDVFTTDWNDGITPNAVEGLMTVIDGADAF